MKQPELRMGNDLISIVGIYNSSHIRSLPILNRPTFLSKKQKKIVSPNPFNIINPTPKFLPSISTTERTNLGMSLDEKQSATESNMDSKRCNTLINL